MANLTEHTMLNGLEENLKSAIESVGGTVPEGTCVWEFPAIIRTLNGGEGINLIGGEGITITKTDEGYVISVSKSISPSAEDIYIDAIDAPDYASGIESWEEGTILQNFLEDLMYKVLPNIPSVTKGDIITTNALGRDPFAPNPESYIDALKPNTKYMRLFLASQTDPIYISLESIEGGSGASIEVADPADAVLLLNQIFM